jgi:prepilin-type processing-associated H-X9-DG protein
MGNSGWFWHRPSVEHNGAGIVTFADGHSEAHRWKIQRPLNGLATTEMGMERTSAL